MPRLGEGVPADLQTGGHGRRLRDEEAREIPADGDEADAHGKPQGGAGRLGEERADDRPDEDGDEGAHLHHGVAAYQLVFRQVLGDDAVFDRAEEGRLEAEEEEEDHEEDRVVEEEPRGGGRHDRDFQELDVADEPCLVVLVGDLPGQGREEKEGQDEEPRGDVYPRVRMAADLFARVKRDDEDQGVLEDVVVESPQELGAEERSETAGQEERELALLPARRRIVDVGHLFSPPCVLRLTGC